MVGDNWRQHKLQ